MEEKYRVECLDCGRDPNGPTNGSAILVSSASYKLAIEIYKTHRSSFPKHQPHPPEKETKEAHS